MSLSLFVKLRYYLSYCGIRIIFTLKLFFLSFIRSLKICKIKTILLPVHSQHLQLWSKVPTHVSFHLQHKYSPLSCHLLQHHQCLSCQHIYLSSNVCTMNSFSPSADYNMDSYALTFHALLECVFAADV